MKLMRRVHLAAGVLLGAASVVVSLSSAHAACGTTATATAGVTTIQSAVDAAPQILADGDHCVSVGPGTYEEQVTVQNRETNGFRIIITGAPGGTVTVSPPAFSNAAFVIANASVSVSGLTILPVNAISYGVQASSAFASVSNVIIQDNRGYISIAGISVSNYGLVTQSVVTVRGAYGVHLPGSRGATISYSQVASSGPARYALYLAGASFNSVNSVTAVNAGGDGAYFSSGSDANTITASTFTGSAGGAGLVMSQSSSNGIELSVITAGLSGALIAGAPGLHIIGGGRNSVARSSMSGGIGGDNSPGGAGMAIESGSDENTIVQCTLWGGGASQHQPGFNGLGGSGLHINGSSYNSVERSLLTGGTGARSHMDVNGVGGGGGKGGSGFSVTGGGLNAVHQSTMTGGVGGGGGVAFGGIGGDGVHVEGSRANSITASMIYAGAGGYGPGPGLGGHGFYSDGGVSNTVDQCVLVGGNGGGGWKQDGGSGGHGFYVVAGGSNAVTRSLMTGGLGGFGDGVPGGTGGDGLRLSGGALNTFDRSFMIGVPGGGGHATGAGGYGAQFLSGADFNAISLSTIAASTGPAGVSGLNFSGVSSNAVTGSYIQGSAAVLISASTGIVIGSSVLIGPNDDGVGLRLGRGSVNLFMTGDTVVTGYLGTGVALDAGNSGVISLVSLAVSGAEFGVKIAAQSSQAQLSITSTTFSGLRTAGSAAIGFLGGVFVSTFSNINFSGPNIGFDVDGSLLEAGSRITMRDASGSRAGPDFEVDPRNVIDWPNVVSGSTPAKPGTPAGTALGISSISWTWSAAANAGAYRIYQASSPTTLLGTAGGTSFIQIRLSSNAVYGIVVAGTSAGISGPLSDPGYAATIVGGSTPVGPAGGSVVVAFRSGLISVKIPPGAFDETVNVTLSVPATYPAAGSHVASLSGSGVGVQITLDKPVTLHQEAIITFPLPAGVDKGRLSLARYNEAAGSWDLLGATQDASGNSISGRTSHFSLFEVMQVNPAATVGDAKVFPNPLRPALGHTAMTISNLPAFARLRIYSLLGELVKDLDADALGAARWDGTNQAGRRAASGVYFIFAQGNGSRKTFRVAVQR